MDTKVISRTPYGEEEPNSDIVQRVRNGHYQVLKEVRSSSGEYYPDPDNALVTIENIEIKRYIGIDQQF